MIDRVIILYAPDEEIIKVHADEIKKSFKAAKFDVTVKAGKNSSMTDIIAANIVVIGTLPEDKKPIHSDFKEIVRSLQGINLAGRIAGFFSPDPDKTIVALQKAMKDSDISIYKEALYTESEKIDSKYIKDWVNKIIVSYKEGFYD